MAADIEKRKRTHGQLAILRHVVDVPLVVALDALQLGGQQRRVVQVVDDEVEAEDQAGEGLLLEGRQAGQIGQRDIGELGEQFLRLRVELEVADLINSMSVNFVI